MVGAIFPGTCLSKLSFATRHSKRPLDFATMPVKEKNMNLNESSAMRLRGPAPLPAATFCRGTLVVMGAPVIGLFALVLRQPAVMSKASFWVDASKRFSKL